MSEKLVIDLSHPVWLGEPGFGMPSIYHPPLCAVGKAMRATWLVDSEDDKEALLDTCLAIQNALPEDLALDDISTLNDAWTNGQRTKENHYAAVRLLLEGLARSGKVEFIGNIASELKGIVSVG